LGAAPGPHSHVWFTIADGNLSEVFYPSIDRPILHSLRFIAAAAGMPPFDDGDSSHDVRWLEPGIPCFTVETRHPEYALTTEFIVDPDGEALLVAGSFRPELPDVRLYLQAVAHDLGDGQVLDREPPGLAVRQGRAWMMLSGPFGRCSAGYLTSSDLLLDLHENAGRMTAEYSTATRGYPALGAELAVPGGPFQLVLGFGGSLAAAEDAAISALSRGATAVRESLARAWRTQSGPDRNLLKVAGDGGALTLSSMTVLRCLEDKRRPGAFVSAPSAPWSDSMRRANVVCNRDLCHIASALLDAGDPEPALRALSYLETTQRDDGSWPLRYGVTGVAEEGGYDLGQIALPILLAWRLGIAGALNRDPYPRLLRQAAACLLNLGPATDADRWQDGGPGASPSSLAAAVAALLATAEFADDAHETAAAEHLRVVADYWQDSLERWTFLESEQRYVRLAGDLEGGAQPAEAVGLEALELVRRGLRRHNDPRVLSTLSRADSELRIPLPQGQGWHRFSGDTYGEADDGESGSGDQPGQGHAWPLLTGERAHYALAAGDQVLDYLRFDWLLIFITAGFVVQNLSRQGDHFLDEIERLGEIVYVIFFATAGAHLDLPLLGQLWPIALVLALARAGCTWGAGQVSSRLAQDPPTLRRWGWAGLVSQAGLALGIAGKIHGEHPTFGSAFAAMAVATVALNELVGPILFKTALDRTGETARHGEPEAAEQAAS